MRHAAAEDLAPAVRKHGELWFSGTLVIGDSQENVDKSEEKIDLFIFVSVVQAEDF